MVEEGTKQRLKVKSLFYDRIRQARKNFVPQVPQWRWAQQIKRSIYFTKLADPQAKAADDEIKISEVKRSPYN